MDIGWTKSQWLDGVNTGLQSDSFIRIGSTGTINGASVTLELHRNTPDSNAITNRGRIESPGGTLTLVTGLPARDNGDGTYQSGTFGFSNNGTIAAAKVIFTAFSDTTVPPGSFNLGNAAQRAQLQAYIDGTVLDYPTDNTPVMTPGVIESIRSTSSFSLIAPQNAASMSHLNAKQQPKVKTLAGASTSEQERGAGKPATAASRKPRPKAKPVLVRGAFFGTKISATISSQ